MPGLDVRLDAAKKVLALSVALCLSAKTLAHTSPSPGPASHTWHVQVRSGQVITVDCKVIETEVTGTLAVMLNDMEGSDYLFAAAEWSSLGPRNLMIGAAFGTTHVSASTGPPAGSDETILRTVIHVPPEADGSWLRAVCGMRGGRFSEAALRRDGGEIESIAGDGATFQAVNPGDGTGIGSYVSGAGGTSVVSVHKWDLRSHHMLVAWPTSGLFCVRTPRGGERTCNAVDADRPSLVLSPATLGGRWECTLIGDFDQTPHQIWVFRPL